MVTKCIREPYMFLGPFLVLFQSIPLVCSAFDTMAHTIVGTITVTLTDDTLDDASGQLMSADSQPWYAM